MSRRTRTWSGRGRDGSASTPTAGSPTRTSPLPGSGTGSSGWCGVLSGSLRVGRGLATRRVRAGGRGVAELGGLDLRGGRGGDLRGDVVAVDHGEVLRLGLRRHVAVVLPLAIGVEDVRDDLLRLVVAAPAGHRRRGVAAGASHLEVSAASSSAGDSASSATSSVSASAVAASASSA